MLIPKGAITEMYRIFSSLNVPLSVRVLVKFQSSEKNWFYSFADLIFSLEFFFFF